MIESFDWAARVATITDGDTLRLHLRRTIRTTHGWREVIESDNPKGQPVRLITLDTPERGQDGHARAKEDLGLWVADRQQGGRLLRVETFETAGWDRYLGDLYAADDRTDTASQHLLRLGWLPYVKG